MAEKKEDEEDPSSSEKETKLSSPCVLFFEENASEIFFDRRFLRCETHAQLSTTKEKNERRYGVFWKRRRCDDESEEEEGWAERFFVGCGRE